MPVFFSAIVPHLGAQPLDSNKFESDVNILNRVSNSCTGPSILAWCHLEVTSVMLQVDTVASAGEVIQLLLQPRKYRSNSHYDLDVNETGNYRYYVIGTGKYRYYVIEMINIDITLLRG
jgi:hypothetical protein